MTTPRELAISTEFKKTDAFKLCDRLLKSAEQVVNFFESKLTTDGSYGSEAKDIACYFKSPMMFIAADKPQAATEVLKHIKTAFMSSDGDFKTTPTLKSGNGAYIEYWSYTNGWILRAANQLKFKSITDQAQKYFDKYNLGVKSGFSTHEITNESHITDVLTIAHHGLINLEMDNYETAISAGDLLCEAIKKQNNLKKGFYLRLDREGNLITQFPKEQTPFYFVSTIDSNQFHFMIGYPAAYLALLFKKTNKKEFLDAAKLYLEFSLSCDKSVYECDFSHKIAWAASLIYECTGDEKYLTVIDKISNYFIAKQKNGMWFPEDINSSYDQSAEIACWFLDIARNINTLKKKVVLDAVKSEPKQYKAWTTQALKYGSIALVAGVGLYALLRPKTQTTTTNNSVVNILKGLRNA